MKLTDWIDGDTKPVRVGVYERDFYFGITYCYWDGKKWCKGHANIDDAVLKKSKSTFQSLPWRGLAEEPK